jgi:type II secretory pathway pseudopilin PulG
MTQFFARIISGSVIAKVQLGSRRLPAAADGHNMLPPIPFAVGKPVSGYSLFELIHVVVVIGLLAAAGLKYYIDLREEALRAGLEIQARNFAAVIQGARADWLLQHHPVNISTAPGSKLYLDLDGNRIYVNEMGWPANSSAELDSSSESQTAAECYELWFGRIDRYRRQQRSTTLSYISR